MHIFFSAGEKLFRFEYKRKTFSGVEMRLISMYFCLCLTLTLQIERIFIV